METYPVALAAPVSVSMVANSYKIEAQALQFNILSPIDDISDFEDASCWDNLSDGLDTAINGPTILLDKYKLPTNNYLDIVDGIICGTASIVPDGSFDP